MTADKITEQDVFIRMSDKMQRLKQLVLDSLDDESVEDTCIDLADYALIAMICRKGLWDWQTYDISNTSPTPR